MERRSTLHRGGKKQKVASAWLIQKRKKAWQQHRGRDIAEKAPSNKDAGAIWGREGDWEGSILDRRTRGRIILLLMLRKKKSWCINVEAEPP